MPAWQEWGNVVLKRIGISQFGPPHYPDHMRATQLIEQIGADQFAKYFSFAFVRNPWDWELSHYKYILKFKGHPCHGEVVRLGSFHEYVRWRCDERFQLQSDFVVSNGEIVVDFLGRFESLKTDFAYVCDKIGVRTKLAQLNKTRRTRYQDHYDDQTATLVEQAFATDIERFGYSFDGTPEAATAGLCRSTL